MDSVFPFPAVEAADVPMSEERLSHMDSTDAVVAGVLGSFTGLSNSDVRESHTDGAASMGVSADAASCTGGGLGGAASRTGGLSADGISHAGGVLIGAASCTGGELGGAASCTGGGSLSQTEGAGAGSSCTGGRRGAVLSGGFGSGGFGVLLGAWSLF